MQYLSLLLLLLLLLPAAAPAAGAGYPVRLGTDDPGDAFYSEATPEWKLRRLYEAVREMGLTHVDIHLMPVTGHGDRNSRRMAETILAIDRDMRSRGLTYTLNVEAPNFRASAEITPGVNEFAHPGGLHRWDLRMEWLRPVLDGGAFLGVVYDEGEHMQLSNNKYANHPRADFDAPFLLNTHGMDVETAYDGLVEAARGLREKHYEGCVPLTTEQVWPDLFHIFARAGWKVNPKLLKEHLSPVVASIALGAALQYADRTGFWAAPDLWRLSEYPGHSSEALRSALTMGYWLGAETVYVENLSYRGTDRRHPDAATTGSLIHWRPGRTYELTAYGRAVKQFAREYVPRNPRPITWRDYRPRVAIVRLPDGGWGQFGDGPRETPSRNRLLGNRDHPLDEAASEWLEVWPVLTHGRARRGAITIFNRSAYPEKAVDFFLPIDSVAVFDHQVSGPVLDEVECFVVCGHALSAGTFRAIAERVRGGAQAIIARRLLAGHASATPPGKWLVVDSFRDARVADALRPFLGPADVARFRFARHVVEFRQGSRPDQITAQVIAR